MKKSILAIVLCLSLCFGLASDAMARTITFGNANGETLYWDILESDGKYTALISANCIACRPFGNDTKWQNSSLRNWLNNDYLYCVFDRDERDAICPVEGDMIRLPTTFDLDSPSAVNSGKIRGSRVAIEHGLKTDENGYSPYFTMSECPDVTNRLYMAMPNGGYSLAHPRANGVGIRIIIKVETNAI